MATSFAIDPTDHSDINDHVISEYSALSLDELHARLGMAVMGTLGHKEAASSLAMMRTVASASDGQSAAIHLDSSLQSIGRGFFSSIGDLIKKAVCSDDVKKIFEGVGSGLSKKLIETIVGALVAASISGVGYFVAIYIAFIVLKGGMGAYCDWAAS